VPLTFGLPAIIGFTPTESLRRSRWDGARDHLAVLDRYAIVMPKAVLKRLEFEQACVALPLDRNSRSPILWPSRGARGARMPRGTVFHASSD
jgi:hypothetical protein